MVSVFGWPDPNTWDVARVKKSVQTAKRVAFLNSRNIPACLDQAIQTRKP